MKLDFKSPKIDDKTPFEKITSEIDSNSFSKSFGSYFLWSENYKTKICFADDILYIKCDKENPLYEMPKGAKTDEILMNAVNSLLEYHEESHPNAKLRFTHLLKPEAEKLEKLFPNKFEIKPERDAFEYVYLVKNLASLKGKKYHSKRGHIAKFSKTHSWKYKPLDISKKEDYISFFELWFKERPDTNLGELEAIKKALIYYDDLKLTGGAVLVGEKIVSCTIGEKVNNETFVVHFEKALDEFADTYTIINNELCKQIQDEYKFINREEDLGISGLRKAKLSYHPQYLIEEYTAVIK